MSQGLKLITGGRDFDSYLAERVLERLLLAAIGEERGDALQSFRGDEASWAQVLDAARTRSLFSPRKAILVRSAEALRGDDGEALRYAKDPTPGVTLILFAAKLDKRKGSWKKIFDAAEVTTAEPLRGRQLKGYVQDELRRRKLALEPEALDALIAHVGADLRRLMGEVEKLEAYAQGQRLEAGALEAILGRGFARPLYEIADAYGERRREQALSLIEQALDAGEPPLVILATLHRALRQVRAARAMQQARVPREEIARRLLSPQAAFKLPGLLEAARRWDEASLRTATRMLDLADRGIKTGGEPRSLLTAAVASLKDATRVRPSPASAR